MISTASPRRSRLALFVIGLGLAGALSCGREVTGPGGGMVAGAVTLRPTFGAVQVNDRVALESVSGLVEFVRVRVILVRATGDTAVIRVVEFPADSQSLSLTLPVVLSASAGADGETLAASLRFVNATGDTVFRGGPIPVQARVAGAAPVTPPEIPLTYTGPGANAASIAITPRTFAGDSGKRVTFSATVRDAQGATLASAPVAYLSSDSTLVAVGLRTGEATLKGLRGTATIYATTLTGQRDSALVSVFAPPAQLAFRTQPSAVAAESALPPVNVAVLDATRDTVRGFVGTMRVALSGGTTGATLGGTTRVTVEAGIARFAGLTVDRAGTGYRLVATLDSIANVPPASSDTFSVGPGTPAAIALISGGGQTISQGVAFPDSVIVRVSDRFGTPVPNATVRFEVLLGAGTVTPPTVVTGTAGRAATQWTAGGPGGQRLRVSVDTVTPLTIDGTALASSGPPIMYVGTETASLGVGRAMPITAYLSNPARATTTITLRSRNDTIAQWATATATIPLNGTQVAGSLTGRTLGSTWAILESAVGTDSVLVTVDSAGMRFGPLPVEMMLTDTIRTTIVLDAPAPAGGLTVTVRSADSTRVRVAPGSGAGFLEEETGTPCYECNALRAADGSEGLLLAPPSGTATLTVPAGRMSAQLVVLPIAPVSDTVGSVALTASAPGVSSVVYAVTPIAAVLDAQCYYCIIAAGHVDGTFVGLAAPLRSPLVLGIATPDTAVVQLVESSLTVPAGQTFATPSRLIVGRRPGTARVIVSATGFAPDTMVVQVAPGALQLTTYNGASVRVGSQLDLRAILGFADSTYGGVGYGAPRADSVTITLTSSDTTIVQPDFTRRVAAAGEHIVRLPATGRRTGSATLTVSAAGYVTGTIAVAVVSGTNLVVEAPSTTGIGVITPITISTPFYAETRLAATTFTITSSDTTALRVLTPRVTLASTALQVEGQFEGLAPGTVVLTVRRDTALVATVTTQVIAPRLGIGSVPSTLDAGETSEVLVFTEADQVRSTSDLLLGVLRSTDPTVLQVTDSILRFVPGEFGTAGVVRGVGAGTARLIALAPGYPPDTSFTIGVRAPRLVFPIMDGTTPMGPGLAWQLPVERRSPSANALQIALTVTGTGGSTPVRAIDTIPAGLTTRVVRIRGGSGTGTDTLSITATGHEPATLLLPTTTPRVYLMSAWQSPIETPFQIGGSFLLEGDPAAEDSLAPRPVADVTLRYRLVSLDTGIVRVLEDTLVIEAGSTVATRLGTARGLRPGVARLTATRLNVTGPVVDTLAIEVTAPRLWHNVASDGLRLGMQQRTENGELYLTRDLPTPKPVWIRLTSSAPTVVTVPDSVLIPADSASVYYVLTARDTVGTALISAQALGHEGASFAVTVTRGRLSAATDGNLITGGRLPILLFATVGNVNEYDGPTLRRHTVPIPLRLQSSDSTAARWVTDTLTIPTGSAYATAALTGVRVGASVVSLEDRRTTFPRLTPIQSTIDVEPGILQVTGGYQTYGGLPVVQAGVGLTSYPQNVEIETNGNREGLVVRFRSLKSRVGFTPDTLVLRGEGPFGPSTLQEQESIGLRGIVPGVDTVEVSAAGHRPDTVLVRIDAGYLSPTVPLATTTLRQGDSTLVQLQLRSPSGDSAIVANGMTLTVTTSPTLAVSGPGVNAGTAVPFSTLAVGMTGTCGIERGTKRAQCWGANEWGQLGDGTFGTTRFVPTPVAGTLAFTAIAPGYTSTCGIVEGGAAYCWGYNFSGQLGNGSTTAVNTPTAVSGGLSFAQIAVGNEFACGLSTAGKVYCWGSNTYGQLGVGDTLPRAVPTAVSGDLTFTQISARWFSACALTTAGAAYCWGLNNSGQLAVGTSIDQRTPAAVLGGLVFDQISSGDFHHCAKTSGGAAYCWGSNSTGQLGAPGSFPASPLLVSGGLSVKAISAGRLATCALTTTGASYCWGSNTFGQLGDGTTTLRTLPTAVAGAPTLASVANGENFSCGLTDAGSAYCWGSNVAGRLGLGTAISESLTPKVVNDLSTVTLTLPVGTTQARFWVKGVSAGSSRLTLTSPTLTTFELQGAVRVP